MRPGRREVLRWEAVTGHDIDRLRGFRRSGQAAALGFQLGPLGGLQGLLGEVAQAGVRVAIAPGWRAAGRLALALRLPLGGCFCALGAFPLVDVIAHALDIALGLLAIRFGNGFLGAHRQGAAPARAGRIGNLHLATGQAAFVDFGAGRRGEQQAGKKGQDYPVHGFVIA